MKKNNQNESTAINTSALNPTPACEATVVPRVEPICEEDSSEDGDGRLSDELLEALMALAARSKASRDGDQSQEENDMSDEDEDEEDEDEEDEEDEDDEEEDEDEEDEEEEDEEDDDDSPRSARADSKNQVLLCSDYKNKRAYSKAVLNAAKQILRKHKINCEYRPIREEADLLSFEIRINGLDCDGHVLLERNLGCLRVDYVISGVKTLPSRSPMIDHWMAGKDYHLRYGAFTVDHSDMEMRLEHAFCIDGGFSKPAFERMFMALHNTMYAYANEVVSLARVTTLSAENKKEARQMISALISNFPAKPKADNQLLFDQMMALMGSDCSIKTKRLLAYLLNTR